MAIKETKEIMPSTLETIDRAFYDWINETLDISSTTNKGWNKVPLIWVWSLKAPSYYYRPQLHCKRP